MALELTRRSALRWSAAALGALSLPEPALASDDLAWPDFLREARSLAEASVRAGPKSEIDHLARLSRLAARDGWTGAAHQYEDRSFCVQRFRIGAGGTMIAHDHHGYVALMRVARGRGSLRQFQVVTEDARARDRFELLERPPHDLFPGALAVVTTHGSNVHQISATEDLELVDLFTFYGEPSSRQIRLESREGDLHVARWA